MVDPVSFSPLARVRASSDAAVSRQPVVASAKTDAPSAASNLPKLVALATELARQGPPIDYVRIAQIRQDIAQGTSLIDPDAIAKAMMSFGSRTAA